MSDRTEITIVALVMAAAGLILLAPLLGRYGAPGWADVVMLLAASAGVGAFAVVAVHTFRTATRRPTRGPEDKP
jgi:hypothetical protein